MEIDPISESTNSCTVVQQFLPADFLVFGQAPESLHGNLVNAVPSAENPGARCLQPFANGPAGKLASWKSALQILGFDVVPEYRRRRPQQRLTTVFDSRHDRILRLLKSGFAGRNKNPHLKLGCTCSRGSRMTLSRCPNLSDHLKGAL